MFDGIEVNGERVTFIDGRTFVASKSTPGRLYETSATECDCRGFQYRGRCRHVNVVVALATMPPIRPPAIPFMAEPSPQPRSPSMRRHENRARINLQNQF